MPVLYLNTSKQKKKAAAEPRLDPAKVYQMLVCLFALYLIFAEWKSEHC